MPRLDKIIVFDAFGTLLRLPEPRRNPYQRLMSLSGKTFDQMRAMGADPMTRNIDFFEFARLAGFGKTMEERETLSHLGEDLSWEVDHCAPFPEALGVLKRAQAMGFRTAIASNLAAPYAGAIERHFGPWLDLTSYSFSARSAKPDAKIFLQIPHAFGLEPEDCVMIGDKMKEDWLGPLPLGFASIALCREGTAPTALEGPIAYCRDLDEALACALSHFGAIRSAKP